MLVVAAVGHRHDDGTLGCLYTDVGDDAGVEHGEHVGRCVTPPLRAATQSHPVAGRSGELLRHTPIIAVATWGAVASAVGSAKMR